MPISAILINVRDIQRSVDFYTTHLGAQLVGEVTRDRADLDLVTATVHLARTEDSELSTWIPDDLQKGFRHVGFKVAAVDPMVAELDAAGVEFHLRPRRNPARARRGRCQISRCARRGRSGAGA